MRSLLTASSIITMNPGQPRAEAVAVDLDSGRILAVGSMQDCRTAVPDAAVEDLSPAVLMPGFIQTHDHPVPAAVLCQQPAHWIAPFAGFPTWGDVEALFRQLRGKTPTGQPLLFSGLDRLLCARWQPYRDAYDGGLRPTFHNDGYVSPPLPWLNIQNAVTRRSASGTVHAADQALTLDEALQAHTINAAWQHKRDHEIGSIEPGKLADFVLLNTDPHTVDPTTLQDTMQVLGTWVSGRRVDLDHFMQSVKETAPAFDQTLLGVVQPPHC